MDRPWLTGELVAIDRLTSTEVILWFQYPNNELMSCSHWISWAVVFARSYHIGVLKFSTGRLPPPNPLTPLLSHSHYAVQLYRDLDYIRLSA